MTVVASLVAGAGIVHCEMFPLVERAQPNPLELFQKTGAEWGLDLEAVTHGAALVDFDGDGDLDVVANNLANNRINHGGPARAIQVIREAQALAPHFTMPAMPVFYLGILVQAHAQLGELGTAVATGRRVRHPPIFATEESRRRLLTGRAPDRKSVV